MSVVIDLRRAFNIVDYNVLLKTLKFYSILVSGDFLRLYISDRSQLYITIQLYLFC